MFDLLWVEREAFPWLYAAAELHMLRAMGIPYVLELDDAVFHRYSDHRFAVVRHGLGDKIEQLMIGARLVIAGSEYIAGHALKAGASWVEHVPTVVDLERYGSGCSERRGFTIGWIGSPATVQFLRIVAGPLREFLMRHDDAQLMVVGVKEPQIEGIDIVVADWTEATECQDVARFDVGIMPLTDGPFEKGKCGYKLIQYGAAAKPVIASPVGANRTIVQDGVNGFLAADDREWIDYLELLYQNPGLRRSMGAAGRAVVEHSFSLQAIAPRVEYLLRRAAGEQES
jgi:glycosyltransferase involved in cell wall biosynthesis